MADEKNVIDDNEKGEIEEDEIVFYRSYIAELPIIIFVLIISAVSIYYTFIYPEYIEFIELFTIFGRTAFLPIPFFLIAPLILLAFIIHRLYDAKYCVGYDYIRATYGLISIKKLDMRLEFLDIRGIEIDRSLYGRIVNTGTLHIGTAMKEDEELSVVNIYNPSQYRDIILKRRKILQNKYNYHSD